MTSLQAQAAFAIVLAVGVAAAAFRVVTAPDRIRDRKDTAQKVCMGAGGQWVQVQKSEVCVRPGESPATP